MRGKFGENRISRRDGKSLPGRFCRAFLNPFSLILLGLAAVSFISDVWFAEPGERDAMTVFVVLTMVMVGGVVRLVQETRSGNAAARLGEMVRTTAAVIRAGEGEVELPLEELVVGDTVRLAAGDMIPADIRIVRAKDLFVSQAALTGESEPVEKTAEKSAPP